MKWLCHPFVEIKRLFTPMEDYWTWTAADGTVYEEVVILHVEKESVAFEHKYGFAAVATSNLSREVQRSLREALEVELAESYNSSPENRSLAHGRNETA
jgi:hypothetical protein